jgi:hypothetical protein
MFGLSEQEMDLYRDLAQDFAVKDVAPQVVGNAGFMTPLIQQDKDTAPIPNRAFLNQLVTDIETIITLTASHMAYEYAYLECESDLAEEEIIKHMHSKYDIYVTQQFIKYGIASTAGVVTEIVGNIILELPYLYGSVIEDDDFDEDEFLEDRLAAYNNYLNENFSDKDDEVEEEE